MAGYRCRIETHEMTGLNQEPEMVVNSIGAVSGAGLQGQTENQPGESATDSSNASPVLAEQFQSFLQAQLEQMVFQNALDQDDDDDDDS
ncbi:MAG: hypothetical protein FWD68_13365 [Alphaproteobacteria bacterium]|nr:hypothetical protein [Alphaproteobacteria bacterium]